ncbi:hypothetical protein MKZ26_03430 [Sporosarcina sp. FSL K6-6792]|uniref:hypothetical protein n=1 Tax=Sporosarcina sp. FSL K6-6792 TaxID=2921559 RepID=UPI0030F8A6D9
MTASIHQNEFDFLEEAKKAFENNAQFETHRNADDDLIALRCGPDRDCINIYQLDREVLFAHNVMKKAPVILARDAREKILTIYQYHAAKPSLNTSWNEGVTKGIEMTLEHLDIKIEGVNC